MKISLPEENSHIPAVSLRECEWWQNWVWTLPSRYLLLCAQNSGSSFSTEWRTKPEWGKHKFGMAVRESVSKWKHIFILLSNWQERTEQNNPHMLTFCTRSLQGEHLSSKGLSMKQTWTWSYPVMFFLVLDFCVFVLRKRNPDKITQWTKT